jgi:hypothetical protein
MDGTLDSTRSGTMICQVRDSMTRSEMKKTFFQLTPGQYVGPWYLFVFAQDVNLVAEGINPKEAAQTIGGFVLTNQLRMAFPPDPCKLVHDKAIQIT